MRVRLSVSARVLVLGAVLLALPCTGYTQEAAIVGTVTDSTGGVLPGVTVTATHTATGNTFFSVTDERGVYRIPGTNRRVPTDRGAARIRDGRPAAGSPCSSARKLT